MTATWDRFHGAALLLAGAGPVKQRLAEAYGKYLVDVEIDELPRELRAEFLALSASLTAGRAVRGQNVVDATVRKFSDAQAAGYAARFITLYGSLARAQSHAQRAPSLRAINSSQG